jgi:hypothetical protein
MALNEETYTKEEWEAIQKGQKIPKKKVIPKPEPAFPKVENLLKYDDIPIAEIDRLINFTMKRIQNEEGIHFIGYDVVILLKPKRGPGRPSRDEEEKELPPRILKGWMIEGDYEKLKRSLIR